MSKKVPMNLMQNVLFALDYATKQGAWVVVVCPDEATQAQCRRIAAGAVPEGASCSGRTTILPGGSRLSVTVVTEEVFVPEDDEFSTLFVGWTAAHKDSRMNDWYQDTQSVLRAVAL